MLTGLTEKCDLYFEGALITKERIVKKYADFFASALSGDSRSVSIALNTGSVCFDAVSFFTAMLGCLSLDVTTPEQIIDALNFGDLVIYKNERYRWIGTEFRDGEKFFSVEQDGRGLNGKTVISTPYVKNIKFVKPYYGSANITDGRGIRKVKSDRTGFLSFVFDASPADIPIVAGASIVVVTERELFDRIHRGLEIVYDGGKTIGLLDIAPASYYSDADTAYQFGSNPSKAEPVLKITGHISTARDLVLDRSGNKIVGLMVVGQNALAKGGYELSDLLGRKSLQFAHISTDVDSESAEIIIAEQEDIEVFACTKEFLLQNSLPPQEQNLLTFELDRQVGNIVNNTVTVINAEGGLSWDEMKKTKEALHTIRKSDWADEKKQEFLMSAHSLLNLFTTAVFTMNSMEKCIAGGTLHLGIASPALKIQDLWAGAETAGSVEYDCAYVADALERFYKSLLISSAKRDALVERLTAAADKTVMLIVPKAYYPDILNEDVLSNYRNVTVVTANRFDNTTSCDEIIVVGDFVGKRFDPLRCRVAEDISIILYECEMRTFSHKKKNAGAFEKVLNSKLGIDDTDVSDGLDSALSEDTADIKTFTVEECEFERYIDDISIFDIKKYAMRASASSGTTPSSEVWAVGRFVSGEQILFSKYYKAVVVDISLGIVAEKDADKLSDGETIVFAKRDDYTRNVVDYIYDGLQSDGRLSVEVLDATEKALYWKECLREYKKKNSLTYREIAKKLQDLGSSLQEMAVRQWLTEESHIVGPRDEATMAQIAQLTGDPYLLSDPHEYFEACRAVRRQRKEILDLVGKAITDKLEGNAPQKGSVLEIVYDNVENLSVILELESVSPLAEPMTVPINLINKPITETEASI
jgi:hypothetical protein